MRLLRPTLSTTSQDPLTNYSNLKVTSSQRLTCSTQRHLLRQALGEPASKTFPHPTSLLCYQRTHLCRSGMSTISPSATALHSGRLRMCLTTSSTLPCPSMTHLLLCAKAILLAAFSLSALDMATSESMMLEHPGEQTVLIRSSRRHRCFQTSSKASSTNIICM